MLAGMRWPLVMALVAALVATPAHAEQEVYQLPALRGTEVYLPTGVYPQSPYFSEYEVELIHAEAQAVPKAVAKPFRAAYNKWRATWVNGAGSMTVPEYGDVVKQGRPVLPLLIEKLLLDDEAPALIVYDHMIPLELFVQSTDEPIPGPVALRVRALRSVRRWLDLSRKETYQRKD